MKELSIEEKAKRYDEAIEIAKEINNEQRAQPFNVMTKVFPELAESEDEKIRKSLIDMLKNDEKCYLKEIAWLEKQGEQKTVSEMKTPEGSLGIDSDTHNKIVDECIYGEQASAWSEKDGEMIDETLYFIREYQQSNRCKDENGMQNSVTCKKWLKNLKQRIGG